MLNTRADLCRLPPSPCSRLHQAQSEGATLSRVVACWDAVPTSLLKRSPAKAWLQPLTSAAAVDACRGCGSLLQPLTLAALPPSLLIAVHPALRGDRCEEEEERRLCQLVSGGRKNGAAAAAAAAAAWECKLGLVLGTANIAAPAAATAATQLAGLIQHTTGFSPACHAQHRGHVGPKQQTRIFHFVLAPRRSLPVRLLVWKGGMLEG